MTLPTEVLNSDATPTAASKVGANMTLADLLARHVELDVDSMNPKYAKQIAARNAGRGPCDMTSNQFVMAAMLCHADNASDVDAVVAQLGHRGWQAVFCRVAALFCKRMLPNIRQRAWVQVSPRSAYNAAETLEWVNYYAEAFEAEGIAKTNYGIKIPTTGPAMCAAKQAELNGISTLGTALFGVAQATAASQARCYAISPYFNEIKAHGDASLCPVVDAPQTEHSMSPRLAQIAHVYKQRHAQTGEKQPQLKLASFIRWQEVVACTMLGSDNVTVLEPVLEQLLSTTPPDVDALSKTQALLTNGLTENEHEWLLNNDPLAATGAYDRASLATAFETDYLANNGAALDAAIAADAAASQRVKDALELFISFEDDCKTFIEDRIAAVLGDKAAA